MMARFAGAGAAQALLIEGEEGEAGRIARGKMGGLLVTMPPSRRSL
jgi:hypothetical protein